MLILSRKLNESVVIDGKIVVKIMRVEGDIVKLGIQAPADVPVHRQEIYDEIQNSNREALTNGHSSLPRLPRVAGRPRQPQSPSLPSLPAGKPSPSFVTLNSGSHHGH